MTDYEQFFPSRFLKASDLPANRETSVVISGISPEVVGDDGDDPRPVMAFRGAKKSLILNRTNADAIAAVYGRSVEGWVGKEVLLYATTVRYKGQTVPCIRCRVPLTLSAPPAAAAPPATAAFDMANVDLAADAAASDPVPF